MMGVIFAVAALAIDAASWMQRHHQTQVVADAAALAAANCLANPGTTSGSFYIGGKETTVAPCSSGTDTADATTVAQDYAQANGLSLKTSQISFDTSTDHVTVSASATSSSFFATLFGINSTTQSAGAQAKWTTGSSACTTAGNSCAAVFAMGSSCSNTGSDPGGSPIIFSGSGDTITGAVHSNGSIYENGGGNQKLGPTTYGNGSGCALNYSSGGGGDTWNGSSTAPSSGQAATTTWPDDYSKVLTACGGSGQVACTGPCINSAHASTDPCTPSTTAATNDKCESASDGCTGTPSYCTKGQASYDFGSDTLTSNNVWCAFGTGSPSDPATYTGLIEFQYGNLGSSSSPFYGTWIGGTIDTDNSSYLATQTSTPTYPVFYATGSGNCNSGTSGGACLTATGNVINGAIFAPNGWIEFNGNGSTTENFLEAQDIYFNGGSQSVVGIGPTNIGGPAVAGTDILTQ
jgi:hypothetical protein